MNLAPAVIIANIPDASSMEKIYLHLYFSESSNTETFSGVPLTKAKDVGLYAFLLSVYPFLPFAIKLQRWATVTGEDGGPLSTESMNKSAAGDGKKEKITVLEWQGRRVVVEKSWTVIFVEWDEPTKKLLHLDAGEPKYLFAGKYPVGKFPAQTQFSVRSSVDNWSAGPRPSEVLEFPPNSGIFWTWLCGHSSRREEYKMVATIGSNGSGVGGGGGGSGRRIVVWEPLPFANKVLHPTSPHALFVLFSRWGDYADEYKMIDVENSVIRDGCQFFGGTWCTKQGGTDPVSMWYRQLGLMAPAATDIPRGPVETASEASVITVENISEVEKVLFCSACQVQDLQEELERLSRTMDDLEIGFDRAKPEGHLDQTAASLPSEECFPFPVMGGDRGGNEVVIEMENLFQSIADVDLETTSAEPNGDLSESRGESDAGFFPRGYFAGDLTQNLGETSPKDSTPPQENHIQGHFVEELQLKDDLSEEVNDPNGDEGLHGPRKPPPYPSWVHVDLGKTDDDDDNYEYDDDDDDDEYLTPCKRFETYYNRLNTIEEETDGVEDSVNLEKSGNDTTRIDAVVFPETVDPLTGESPFHRINKENVSDLDECSTYPTPAFPDGGFSGDLERTQTEMERFPWDERNYKTLTYYLTELRRGQHPCRQFCDKNLFKDIISSFETLPGPQNSWFPGEFQDFVDSETGKLESFDYQMGFPDRRGVTEAQVECFERGIELYPSDCGHVELPLDLECQEVQVESRVVGLENSGFTTEPGIPSVYLGADETDDIGDDIFKVIDEIERILVYPDSGETVEMSEFSRDFDRLNGMGKVKVILPCVFYSSKPPVGQEVVKCETPPPPPSECSYVAEIRVLNECDQVVEGRHFPPGVEESSMVEPQIPALNVECKGAHDSLTIQPVSEIRGNETVVGNWKTPAEKTAAVSTKKVKLFRVPKYALNGIVNYENDYGTDTTAALPPEDTPDSFPSSGDLRSDPKVIPLSDNEQTIGDSTPVSLGCSTSTNMQYQSNEMEDKDRTTIPGTGDGCELGNQLKHGTSLSSLGSGSDSVRFEDDWYLDLFPGKDELESQRLRLDEIFARDSRLREIFEGKGINLCFDHSMDYVVEGEEVDEQDQKFSVFPVETMDFVLEDSDDGEDKVQGQEFKVSEAVCEDPEVTMERPPSPFADDWYDDLGSNRFAEFLGTDSLTLEDLIRQRTATLEKYHDSVLAGACMVNKRLSIYSTHDLEKHDLGEHYLQERDLQEHDLQEKELLSESAFIRDTSNAQELERSPSESPPRSIRPSDHLEVLHDAPLPHGTCHAEVIPVFSDEIWKEEAALSDTTTLKRSVHRISSKGCVPDFPDDVDSFQFEIEGHSRGENGISVDGKSFSRCSKQTEPNEDERNETSFDLDLVEGHTVLRSYGRDYSSFIDLQTDPTSSNFTSNESSSPDIENTE